VGAVVRTLRCFTSPASLSLSLLLLLLSLSLLLLLLLSLDAQAAPILRAAGLLYAIHSRSVVTAAGAASPPVKPICTTHASRHPTSQ
jgi:hypothetical protein